MKLDVSISPKWSRHRGADSHSGNGFSHLALVSCQAFRLRLLPTVKEDLAHEVHDIWSRVAMAVKWSCATDLVAVTRVGRGALYLRRTWDLKRLGFSRMSLVDVYRGGV
jgi:hypothetical protein